jgi:alkanesulfonate monooxygenase SsuD/methylene tetrahydromethanopterin reductase-like flavin-dependent oxidoreductase (luciferase family)
MYRRGYTHENIRSLGVKIEDAERLNQAEKAGVSAAAFDNLVTDGMIDAIFIAGEPEDCLDRMIEVQGIAQSQGFSQLMFSELGPDVDEALNLLCDVVIPAL